MPEYLERLRELDRVQAPDVWLEVKRRGPRTPIEPSRFGLRRVGVTLLALAIAIAGFLLVARAFRGRSMVRPGKSPSPSVSTPAPARNGLIAFGCGYHICTVRPDGSGFTDLIAPYNKDLVVAAYSPVFSPDGSKIAFRGYGGGGPSAGGGANYDIYVMNADGSGLANLTTSPADVKSVASQDSPQWSPDGSMIAYNSDAPAGGGVYVMNADGSDQRKLSDGGGPTWSPDGSQIAFVNAGNLWTIHPDGTGLTQLTQSPKWPELPTWSPDGSRIAFLRGSAIYVVNADGSGLTTVADLKGVHPFQPQWSPDGTQLAFEGENGPSYDIYVVNADGTGLTDIAGDPKLDENYPVWSPDGTLIAYAASEVLTGENTGTYDLYVMRPDGTSVKRLTTNAHLGVEFDISWQRASE